LLLNKYKASRIDELLDNLSASVPTEIATIRAKLYQ